jgi:hypothetical protein
MLFNGVPSAVDFQPGFGSLTRGRCQTEPSTYRTLTDAYLERCDAALDPVSRRVGAGTLVERLARAKIGELMMRLELAEHLIEKRGLTDEWKKQRR